MQPTLVLSHVFGDRFEPLVNVGIDMNANDVDRSIVHWAIGTTAQLGPVTGVLVFLGRHELDRRSDPIEPPFFFQIERNQQYDASVGLRWRFADTGFVSANALVPLNQQGLRADVIPTVAVEYAFSAPWE